MTEAERLAAYEDALRGIAAAAVACRARVRGFVIPLDAAGTLLADVEHHLSSRVALGAVPSPGGRPVTSSAPLPGSPRAVE